MNKYKALTLSLSIVLTLIVIRMLLVPILFKLITSDLVISMEPGWHTTIQPNYTILTLMVLFISGVVYLTFHLMNWVVNKAYQVIGGE
jgi:hypothetical protein